MSDSEPIFFFSYARKPDDPLLEDFFKKLAAEASISDAGEGFRDTSDIKSGDDWTEAISKAVQTSKVLLCIYTPHFFKSPYCGKEFAAFLKRNAELKYVPVQEADGKTKYSAHKVRNIIPILWTSRTDLEHHPNKLPPHLVSAIQYTIQDTGLLTDRWRKSYQDFGLRMTYSRASADIRRRFAKHFADTIRDAKPLPSLDRPHSFEELWDAFQDIPLEYAPEDVAPGSDVAEPPAAPAPVSPGEMVAIEITTASNWTLYPGGPTLAAAVAEIAYDCHLRHSSVTLDPSSDGFEKTASSIIEEATTKQAMPILFVDPACLKIDQQRSAIVRLIECGWRGGIILPGDKTEMVAATAFKDSLPNLKRSLAEGKHIVVRASSTEMDKLRTSVDSVALEIFAKIADVAEVQQKPRQQIGPDTRPRISNHPPVKGSGNDAHP
jgi:TIR domain